MNSPPNNYLIRESCQLCIITKYIAKDGSKIKVDLPNLCFLQVCEITKIFVPAIFDYT